MKFEVEKLPKNTFSLKIVVPQDEVLKVKDHVIEEMIKEVDVAGFRKGMAPREVAEKSIDESKIRGEVLNHAISTSNPQAIKESRLSPIIYPRVEVKDFELGKDLVFEAKFCERPEITLGDYHQSLAGLARANSPAQILGGDGQPLNNKKEGEEIDHLLNHVLETSQIHPSDLLIDEEVNHMLSRLIDQTARLGMTVDQYLKSADKTVEQVKEEYRQVAEKTLKLEFLLYAIAEKENVAVTDEEISDTIKAAPDDKSREELNREENRSYVKSVMLKNKAIQLLVGIYEGAKNEQIKSS